ncbi:MAG: hypothetical protein HY424_00500 [Candidatus Levybacteria bacterium]|nr:hypothetical protein [Candidatus Levybacteria bacterium]
MAMQHIEGENGVGKFVNDPNKAKAGLARIIAESTKTWRELYGEIALPSVVTPASNAVVAVEKVAVETSVTPSLTVESLPSVEQLTRIESEALKRFFGKDIVVPKPPQELFQTLETMSKLGFEPHFLPQVSLTEADKIPGWKVKPQSWFWQNIKDGKPSADAAVLQEGWYLVDGRGKPNYDNGQQRYEDDYLESIMANLRKTGKIQKYSSVPDSSRFGASPNEIEQVILPEVARKTGAKGNLTNKRYIEFNVWGNMFHPEWGQTDTLEWFADEFGGGRRLFGGDSGGGGLGYVYDSWSDNRGDSVAFGPVVRFPSKP